MPPSYYSVFADDAEFCEFPLPPNYEPENDPYSDSWGVLSDEERRQIPEWNLVYHAMAANLDTNFGRLLRAIDRAGLGDNTIVVFTSDHGEMMGAQGRRAKNVFYEEAVRVPFLVRWPERIPVGRISDACLNAPDVMPTLLSMMGLPVPGKVEGMDLSHCAFGKPGPEPAAAFMQCTGAVASWEDGHEWRALRSKQHTYAVYRVDRRELLFDNLADPYQMHNLSDDPGSRDLLDHYRALMRRRMSDLGDTFEASTWYRDHWTRDRVITCVR